MIDRSKGRLTRLRRANARLARKLRRVTLDLAEARHLGFHDSLTGLPNRALLFDRLKQAMAQSVRNHHQLALLLVDLDEFKAVNDRFGHAAGDQLLRQVAGRLSGCIRSGDTACRYGGDEFLIMLPETEGPAAVEAVAEKVRARLLTAYELDKGIVSIAASVGTAIYRAGEKDYNSLIEQADAAMYLDKASHESAAGAAGRRDLRQVWEAQMLRADARSG
jgi:diguanylate cyclase